MFKVIRERQAFHIANAAFLLVWLTFSFILFNRPYVGLVLKEDGSHWVVARADIFGEGYRSGVRVGDVIVEINNYETAQHPSVKRWGEGEGALLIEAENSEHLARTFEIQKTHWTQTFLQETPMLLLGIVFWLLGMVTWLKRPFLIQARALFRLNWFIGIAIVLAPASSRDLLYARELELAVFSMIPPLLVHFISVFPVVTKSKIGYISVTILSLMSLFTTILLGLKWLGIIHVSTQIRSMVLVSAILGSTFVICKLILLLKRPSGIYEKNQTIMVLIGCILGFMPFTMLSAFPMLLYGHPFLHTKITAVFISIVPASWSYVIINKYLPDGRWLLETIVSYMLSGMAVAGLLIYMFYFLGLVSKPNIETFVVIFSLTLLIYLVFHLIKNCLNKLFSITLPKKSGLKEKINELNNHLSTINEDSIIKDLVNGLEIEGAFIIIDDNQGTIIKKSIGTYSENLVEQKELENYYFLVKNTSNPALFQNNKFPAEVFVPVICSNFGCGIFLGHRSSMVKFRSDEFSQIILLCNNVGRRLETTQTVKKLSSEISSLFQKAVDNERKSNGLKIFNKSLLNNMEKERKALAREIHDGPVQLGCDANRRLKMILEQPLLDGEITKKIEIILEIVKNLDFELRSVCTNLRPASLTELGLVIAVESMCSQIMQKEFLIISLDIRNLKREQRLKEEIEVVAFRFVQEGLANVIKHSGANQVQVLIQLANDNLKLLICDSGKGFNANEIKDWVVQENHLGIIGMKERVEDLGGSFQIQTQTGRGVTLQAILPVLI